MKIQMPDLTPGQDKFIFEMSRLIPEALLITQVSPQLRVGTTVRISGKRGVVRLLFFNHQGPDSDAVGSVIAWEDGSITVPSAVLDYLAHGSGE